MCCCCCGQRPQPPQRPEPPQRPGPDPTDIDRRLKTVEKKIKELGVKVSATQDQIDALAATLHQEDSDLNTAIANIEAWIAAHPDAPDLSGLQAEVANLGTAVSSAAGLVPAPPADGS